MSDVTGDVMRVSVCGVDVAAVLLPSDLLAEDRVARMNDFWDMLDQREVLVLAVSTRGEGR